MYEPFSTEEEREEADAYLRLWKKMTVKNLAFTDSRYSLVDEVWFMQPVWEIEGLFQRGRIGVKLIFSRSPPA